MIIGLVGLKGSGKDTVAAYLMKEHNFERHAFADPLKRSLAAFLDIPYHEIENFKNAENVFVTTGYKNNPPIEVWEEGVKKSPDKMWSPIRELTFREALQRYGTEAHRDVFGTDFWVNATLPVGGYYTGRNMVITDCRFLSEADRITTLGGKLVRISRPNSGSSEDPHRSETEQTQIVVDYELVNAGTIEDLYDAIETMLVNQVSK